MRKGSTSEMWISVGALIISIFALATSMKTCMISQKTHYLNNQQYLDSFLTICTGEYLKDIEAIKIVPSNKNVVIQKAFAIFPDPISNAIWPIEPPNYYLNILLPKSSIEKIFRPNIRVEKSMHFFPEIYIPIILEIYYTLNGENRHDKSLYSLECPSLLVGGELIDTFMDIRGLIFRERLDLNIDAKNYLKKLWKKTETHWEGNVPN